MVNNSLKIQTAKSISTFSGYKMYKSDDVEVKTIVSEIISQEEMTNSNTSIKDSLIAADDKHTIYTGGFVGLKIRDLDK